MKRQVFFSFHYKADACRTGQIRNIGVLEGGKIVSDNDWEKVRGGSYDDIQRWINEQLDKRSCTVVLIGTETANRDWIKYEIMKSWELGKGLVGIYVHNLKDPQTGCSQKGKNPFDNVILQNGATLSSVIKPYDPLPSDAYNCIKNNIESWIEEAIERRPRNIQLMQSSRQYLCEKIFRNGM
ncbi:MAG: TIR domain-containing protein [Holosporales bacterium]|jgi:hypothetical protein|nr:TIR domain-containing protein [Holosporales bacterium]